MRWRWRAVSKLSVMPRPTTCRCCRRPARWREQGFVTGASHRNWASYGDGVVLPADMPDWQRHLLTDPQTSGGLLVACAAERAASILQTIKAGGFPAARIIGKTEAGKPSIKVV